MTWLYGAAILLGSLLLFLVQPMCAKMLLPSMGGTPAAWNTCMAFFQAGLLGGICLRPCVAGRAGSASAGMASCICCCWSPPSSRCRSRWPTRRARGLASGAVAAGIVDAERRLAVRVAGGWLPPLCCNAGSSVDIRRRRAIPISSMRPATSAAFSHWASSRLCSSRSSRSLSKATSGDSASWH